MENANIWENDKLGRREFAVNLSKYLVNRYERYKSYGGGDPNTFVLNLDSKWGDGKTFFLTRWQKELQNQNHPVVYFDAWANDFSDNPLLAFINEVNVQLSQQFGKKSQAAKLLGSVVDTGKKISATFLPVLKVSLVRRLTKLTAEELKNLIEGKTGFDVNDEDKKDIQLALSSLANASLKDHNSKKNEIERLRRGLKGLVDKIEQKARFKTPIVFMIDELDRCRPSFAIELLENIKHLFGVDGCYFVVATDTEQLSNAVQAVYGPNFEGKKYLGRFFDQETKFNDFPNLAHVEYLFDKYKISQESLFVPKFCEASWNTPEFFTSKCAEFFKLNARDINKSIAFLERVIDHSGVGGMHLGYLLPLIMMRVSGNSDALTAYKASSPSWKTYLNNDIAFNKYIEVKISQDVNPSVNSHMQNIRLSEVFSTYLELKEKSYGQINNIMKDNVNSMLSSVCSNLLLEMDGPFRTNSFDNKNSLFDYVTYVESLTISDFSTSA